MWASRMEKNPPQTEHNPPVVSTPVRENKTSISISTKCVQLRTPRHAAISPDPTSYNTRHTRAPWLSHGLSIQRCVSNIISRKRKMRGTTHAVRLVNSNTGVQHKTTPHHNTTNTTTELRVLRRQPSTVLVGGRTQNVSSSGHKQHTRFTDHQHNNT